MAELVGKPPTAGSQLASLRENASGPRRVGADFSSRRACGARIFFANAAARDNDGETNMAD